MHDLMNALGLRIQDLFAAFLGGVASAFFMPTASRWQIVGTVFVGTVAGNYFGEWVADKLTIGRGGACVLVGFTAMVVAKRLLDIAATMKLPALGGKTDGKP